MREPIDYRTIFENLDDSIFIIDAQGKILQTNSASEKMTGLLRGNIMGKKLRNFIEKEDRTAFADALRKAGADGFSSVEIKMKAKNIGRWLSVSFRKKGEKSFIVTAHDVTESKRAFQKLTLINELLRKMTLSLNRKEIVDTVIEIVEGIMEYYICALLFIDEEKEELYAARAVGFTRDMEKARIPISSKKSISAHVARTRKPYYCPDISKDTFYLNYAEDVKAEFACPIMVSGRLYGVLDIESKNADAFSASERELIEILASTAALALDNALLYERLASSNQMKEMFISLMSHDLKNPLQTVYGYAELLKEKAGGENRVYLDKIREAAVKMDTLITNVRLYSKLEAGAYVEKFEDKDLCVIILSAMRSVEHEAKKKSIQIQYIPSPHILRTIPITENIFVNLLDNAIKYSDKDGRVAVETEEENGWVRVKIKDEGMGIPPQYRSLIFSRFQRANEAKEIGGSGLGLALVSQIVELHGGKVRVEDNLPQGSIFIVELPKSR